MGNQTAVVSANPASASQHSRHLCGTFHVQRSGDGGSALRVVGHTLVRPAVVLLCTSDSQRAVAEGQKMACVDRLGIAAFDPARETFHSLSRCRCAC